MKKYLNILLTVSTILFIERCNPFETNTKQPKPYSIVFCDFTTSVDTVHSIEKIKDNALKILSAEAKDKIIEFYAISKDNNSDCLYRSTPLIDDPKPSEERKFRNDLIKGKDSLKNLLDMVSNASLLDRKEPNSCIIDCIERSIKYFRNHPNHETVPLRLFILSDMLECCTINGRKPICIEPPADIKSKLDVISLITDSTLSFKEFKNIEVYIILSTNNKHLGYGPDFNKFWETVFMRYKYDKILYCSVNLPNNIKDK